MDKINLNLYGLNFQKQVEKKEEEKKAEDKAPAKQEGKNVNSEAIFDAMQLSAAQNKAVVLGNALTIDPKKYLDDESIARIQGFMGDFESKTEDLANVIAAEFPGLSEAQIMALAARATLQTL